MTGPRMSGGSQPVLPAPRGRELVWLEALRMTRRAIVRGVLALAAGVALLGSSIGPGAAQGSWSERAQMLVPRSETAIAELDGLIYVLGGYGGDRKNSDVVQVYDSRSDTWAYGPPLPMPIHHAMAAVVGGRLFLIGGEVGGTGTPVDPSSFADTVYELDPSAGAWLLRAPMPFPRSAGAVGIIDGNRCSTPT